MLFVLFILLGFSEATLKEDIGDIPYENQDNAVDKPAPETKPSVSSPASEYGEIPYERVFNKADFGDIPYEEIIFKPRVEDYGIIPYEHLPSSSLPTRTTRRTDINIKGKILQILGNRVTGLLDTKKSTIDPWSSLLSTNLTTESAFSLLLTIVTNATLKMRADDSAHIDYKPPVEIDDSDCNPAKQNCSFCYDKMGYRVYCKVGVTTPAPSDLRRLLKILADMASEYEDYHAIKQFDFKAWNRSIYKWHPYGWVSCPSTTTTTDTPIPTDPPHNLSGQTIAKCYVCGMSEPGIPHSNAMCGDSFLSKTYKKHCKFLNRKGFHTNGSGGFYFWGQWTGGCSMRFVDISDVYTQRTCRNRVAPTVGLHYVSRRMAQLEKALKLDTDACVSSPQASLVPLSRGISLYSRFTVCVCSTNYCNRTDQQITLLHWFTAAFGVAISLLASYF